MCAGLTCARCRPGSWARAWARTHMCHVCARVGVRHARQPGCTSSPALQRAAGSGPAAAAAQRSRERARDCPQGRRGRKATCVCVFVGWVRVGGWGQNRAGPRAGTSTPVPAAASHPQEGPPPNLSGADAADAARALARARARARPRCCRVPAHLQPPPAAPRGGTAPPPRARARDARVWPALPLALPPLARQPHTARGVLPPLPRPRPDTRHRTRQTRAHAHAHTRTHTHTHTHTHTRTRARAHAHTRARARARGTARHQNACDRARGGISRRRGRGRQTPRRRGIAASPASPGVPSSYPV